MSLLDHFEAVLLRLVRRFGTVAPVALITAVAIVMSVVTTLGSFLLWPGQGSLTESLLTSVLIPLVVAPAASLVLLNVLVKLADAHDQLEILASTDSLTGVANRRAFHERAEARIARRRPADVVVVGMIDVDDFKHINDAHGHATGDEVLRVLSDRLVAAVGDRGVVGRLGGDELAVVVIAGADELEAATAALRTACHGFTAGQATAVAASIGLQVLDDEVPLAEALRRSDAALYEAKASGRAAVRT